MLRISMCIVLAVNAWSAVAQSPTPYAGQQTRDIKALSSQEIADLAFGRGMGLAKAAELNGYPGPAHVLEMRAALDLTDIRAVHLNAHLEQAALLTAEQIDRYNELRGYGPAAPHDGHPHVHH